MPGAGWELQKSIYTALAANAELIALLGAPRIHDDVPPDVAYPYVTLGETTIRDWGTGSEEGDEHSLTLHVWSRAAGRGETQQIMSALRSALHDVTLSVAGHRLVNLRHDFFDARREPDGETYHGILRFRAVTEPLP